ncbi:MAG: hypothetical protein FJW30_24485 [Acidobacteria bacterium]|nr:hypothetical protein [Acidobacteriota bacterium]
MKKLLLATLLTAFGADLAAVKSEPNLEKRAEKALVYAGELITAMRAELDRGDLEKIKEHLREFQGGIDLCVDSLDATGKNARRNPKHFKRAEMRMRELNRRLQTFRFDLGVDDRPLLDDVTTHVGKRIDELVNATLRGK